MAGIIAVDVKGLLPLKRQMALLAMPRLQRQKLLKYVAYKLVRDTRKRVRQRININGMPFSDRPDSWKDKHAIDRVAKFLSVKSDDGLTAEIGWKREHTAKLAKRIQDGSNEFVDDDKKTEAHQYNAEKAPATRWQARALVANGYLRPGKKGRPGRLATVRWIRGKPIEGGKFREDFNMTARQASAILASMRKRNFKRDRQAKGIGEEEQVNISARPFLGASRREVNQYLLEIMNKYSKEVTNGRR